MNYKKVIVTERGGPEVLKVIEAELRPPLPGEARIKILAAPVCAPDITARLWPISAGAETTLHARLCFHWHCGCARPSEPDCQG